MKQDLLMAGEEEAAAQNESHKPGLQELHEAGRLVNSISGAALAAPAVPAADASRLLSLLERCMQSPRRPDYPGLENNLARAEICVARVIDGADDAEDCYRAAWSLLRNMSYPLLGE
jgi:DNA-binding FadR family transcriptional regulator